MTPLAAAPRKGRSAAAFGRRLASLLLVLALAGPGAGCARLFHGYDLAPNGLTREEDRLRTMLARGEADSLHAALTAGRLAPHGDRLLGDLYRAVAAYYGGAPTVSGALLDSAAFLAEERQTRSVSRAAASLLSSDRTLEWIPGPTERLLVPYYAALSWLAMGDREAAAVEARRLSALLEAEEAPPASGLPLRAALRYFAGAVFEAAGERNDAAVAYRNAAALDAAGFAMDTLPLPAGQGEVLLVLERGFVAHRVERSFTVLLEPPELRALSEGDAAERLAAATLVAGRVLLGEDAAGPRRGTATGRRVEPARRPATEEPRCSPGVPRGVGGGVIRPVADTTRAVAAAAPCPQDPAGPDATDIATEDEDDDTPYLLRVAWPAYASTPRPHGAALLHVDSTLAVPVSAGADLSASVTADFEERRVELVARTLARAAAKAALSRGVEKGVAEKDETAGAILGILSNVGTALLERADTRGWNLLPGQIDFARVRLPAGHHTLRVSMEGGRVVELGQVHVADGTLTVLPARAW